MELKLKKSFTLYKVIAPDHLQGQELDGYYMKTLTRHLLEVVEEDISEENALKFIEKNQKDYVYSTFVILPTISIEYEI